MQVGESCLLWSYVDSDGAATVAYDGAVSSANLEGSDSLPEESASNVHTKRSCFAELLGGETKAASAHEANSDHGVSPLGTDSSADEGADDK